MCLFRKVNKCGILINDLLIILAAIGVRGVMKKKIFSLALVLSLVGGALAACDSGGGTGGTGGGASTSPSESPSASPSISPSTSPSSSTSP